MTEPVSTLPARRRRLLGPEVEAKWNGARVTETMRAIVQDRYGGADTLRVATASVPKPGKHDALVHIKAAGVDRGAYHLMRGLPYVVRLTGTGLRAPRTAIPGTNIAGTILDVGSAVGDLWPGDEVYGTCRGAFAEYAVTAAARLALKPPELTFEEAAVLPYPGAVALQAVRDRGHADPGTSMLVVGASGAVGTIAVQIGRAVGARVTAVCSAANAALVRRLGADRVIDYTKDDFTASGPRHDVILDIGGNTPLRRLRRVLARDGTLVIVGGELGGRVLGGFQRQIGAQLLSPFVRQHLGTLIASERAEILRSLNVLVGNGLVRPVMGRCYRLDEAADAIADLDAGSTQGRLVVVP